MRAVHRLLAVLTLLPGGVGKAGTPPDGDVLALQRAVERAIERNEPAVACILVSRSELYAKLDRGPPSKTPGCLGGFSPRRFHTPDEELARLERSLDLSDPDNVPESYGSGLVIDSSGLVLTCAHVVRNATKVYVRLADGKGSWADIHASDPRSDLAVLQLQEIPRGLRTVTFGNGGDLRKGQFVIGLANPYAAGHRDGSPSAARGIVSNLRRRAPGVITETDRMLQSFHRYGTLVQTDMQLSAGCSGGAVLNLNGEVVAITTAVAGLTGLDAPGGFAVPVDARMKKIIEVLARGHEVEYGFLGVTLAKPDDRRGPGAGILGILPNGPAAKARLQPGDRVVAINDNRVRDNDDLLLQIGSLTAGSDVRLEILRDGRKETVKATLAKLYVAIRPLASNLRPDRFGVRVDYVSVLSQRSIGSTIPDGVVIAQIVAGEPAEKANLRPDQVITAVNGIRVTTPDEFEKAAAQFEDRIQLTVINADHREETITLHAK